jgi:hypothetical protein
VGRDRPLSRFARTFWNLNLVPDTHAGNAQHAIDRLDVAFDMRAHLVGFRGDLTHCQCAGKGAEQSTADGGNHVIQRGRNLLVRLDAVELFDRAVHAEPDRLAKRLDEGVANRTFDPFDPDTARVDSIGHGTLLRGGRYHGRYKQKPASSSMKRAHYLPDTLTGVVED